MKKFLALMLCAFVVSVVVGCTSEPTAKTAPTPTKSAMETKPK